MNLLDMNQEDVNNIAFNEEGIIFDPMVNLE